MQVSLNSFLDPLYTSDLKIISVSLVLVQELNNLRESVLGECSKWLYTQREPNSSACAPQGVRGSQGGEAARQELLSCPVQLFAVVLFPCRVNDVLFSERAV